MYTVVYSKKFKKAYKILAKDKKINKQIIIVIHLLMRGKKLDRKYRNHKLKGSQKDFFECHIQPDLLLIYEKQTKELRLILINIGSHAKLFKK